MLSPGLLREESLYAIKTYNPYNHIYWAMYVSISDPAFKNGTNTILYVSWPRYIRQ
jgi:hypothetical protein